MNIQMIEPADISSEWEWLSVLLEPAIDWDETRTLADVKLALKANLMTAWKVIGPEYAGIIVTRMENWTEDTPHRVVAWISYVSGHVLGGPKRKKEIMRELAETIEKAASNGGAKELRLQGRKSWASVLNDWDTLWQDKASVELRKIL